MYKKIPLLGAAIVSGLALAVTFAFAAQLSPMNLSINNSGFVKLAGTVSAVSGSTISVSSWGGTWLVNTSGAVVSPSLSDIKVGDTVKVSGEISSGMSINAKKVKDTSVKKQTIVGTSSNINATLGTFTLSNEHSDSVDVKTNANTKIYLKDALTVFGSLTNNMHLMVSGLFNSSTNIMTAGKIKILQADND